jgi:hypothetical protein
MASSLNTGRPWSAFDDFDLETCDSLGQSDRDIADLLCRELDEIPARRAALARMEAMLLGGLGPGWPSGAHE